MIIIEAWAQGTGSILMHRATEEGLGGGKPGRSNTMQSPEDPRVVAGKAVYRMPDGKNLTMRMGIRRFTRLTNAHSKKLENHGAAVALHFAHYNFVRRHQTLRCTPAMAAGVSSTMWSMDELVDAALAHEAQP
jgi:hypothetical protein